MQGFRDNTEENMTGQEFVWAYRFFYVFSFIFLINKHTEPTLLPVKAEFDSNWKVNYIDACCFKSHLKWQNSDKDYQGGRDRDRPRRVAISYPLADLQWWCIFDIIKSFGFIFYPFYPSFFTPLQV